MIKSLVDNEKHEVRNMETMVQTYGLTKQYGRKIVLNNVSINIQKGDIYGLIGKNGAGKTTLMKILLGLTSPKVGQIQLFGGEALHVARKKIGSLLETPALYGKETAFENMKRFAILTNTSDSEICRLLDLVGLGNTGKKKAGQFSLGMRQRLAIAIALMGDPEILILDEPINGLDPAGIKEIRDVILELNAKGVTFLISSHLLDELGKIATRYGILSNGYLVEEISKEELEERCRSFLVVRTDDGEAAANLLQEQRGDISFNRVQNDLHILTYVESWELNAFLVRNGVKVHEMYVKSVGVENFFIERMGR